LCETLFKTFNNKIKACDTEEELLSLLDLISLWLGQ